MRTQQAVLVLGATGGIGQALCRILHAQGARLSLAARRPEPLAALSRELGEAPTHQVDATQSAQVTACVEQAHAELGGLTGIAHCVGSLFLKPPHLTEDKDLQEHMAINLYSAYYVVRAASQALRSSGGSVVLISSVAARFGLPNHEVIAAAKAGIVGLTLSAAASGAAHNIRVNAVAPGLIETPLTASLRSTEALAKASAGMHPLGRLGSPEDVAHTVGHLLHPDHAFITGQVWGVDGGMSSVRPSSAARVRA